MNPVDQFNQERSQRLKAYAADSQFARQSQDWVQASMQRMYVYNFDWLGRPIIQYPQDILAMQEIIWRVKPDLIIETGIAHGGSLVLSASMLAQLDICEAIEAGVTMDPAVSKRKVLGIDIDIRAHNRELIESHPMASRIAMIQGSSTDDRVIEKVQTLAAGYKRVMVCLDSNHTHEHVLAELMAYAPLVSVGSYCIVFDTFVENMPAGFFANRPWDPGNNPLTATREYLVSHPEFAVDRQMQDKLQITVAPEGYLLRTSA